jgi:hypothetical protein
MNRQDSVDETTVANPVRPSLYANTLRERSAKATEVFSILESLEPSRKQRGRGILLALGGFSLLAAAVLVTHPDVGYLAGTEAWMAARLGRPAKAPVAAVPEQIASAPQASGEDPAAAAIVSEVAEETLPLQDASAEDEVAAVLPLIADSPSLPAVAPAGKSAAAVGESHKGSTGVKPVTGGKAAARPHSKKHAGKPARTPHRSTASKPGAKDKDKDVALIAALLSHVSASGSPAPKKGAGSTPATKSAETTSTAKRETAAPTNRDVIIRTADESTDTLVRRCRTLGLLEGQLCRIRICSGLWGKDPACPAGGSTSPEQ